MLVVMHSHATPAEIEQVAQAIREMNLTRLDASLICLAIGIM